MNEEPLIKVLIVDDDEDIVLVLKDFFEGIEQNNNLLVMTSSIAADAKEKLREVKPDVLITDILIPGADGYQLAEIAKQVNANCYVTIISGKSNNENNPIINNYLKKPFEFEKFESLVNEMINYVINCRGIVITKEAN